ncbi:hypothetical protein [Microvirga roseola]|uniref:hypothetical protein n=1 Tax=Microvirga roseola TaxID=2883126 RepID=UPI001E411B75|nr:hypothetical protein [Microvirga roseola]
MSDPQSKDRQTSQANEASDDERRDEVLKRMLSTKPQPHKAKQDKGGKSKPEREKPGS